MDEYVTLDKTFYGLPFKQEVVAAPVTSKFSSLLHARGGLYYKYNIIIILCINYITIIFINIKVVIGDR
jgi:hypothetical protein